MKTQPYKILGCSKSSPKRQVLIIQALLKKQEKSQINNLTYHLKELEKEPTKPKVSRRKMIKIREEIKIEIKKQQLGFFKKDKQKSTSSQPYQEKKRTQGNKIRNETGEITDTQKYKTKQNKKP